MRTIFLTLFLVLSQLHGEILWQTDYEQALSLCEKEKKPLLLFFTGSDWSGLAMQLKHEILDSDSFQDKIASKFICVEVDFPKYTPAPTELMVQNANLKERFNIHQTPMLLVLDGKERTITKIGYLPENGALLADDLLRVVSQDAQLCEGLKQLDSPPIPLRKLYQLAQELRQRAAIEQILEAGLRTDDPFFFLEKYRLLVEKGEMKSEEAHQLRQKLLSLDPYNEHHVHYTLALIEFQELSDVRPLQDYLEQFGNTDQENVWQIEMMIAQFYLDMDQWEEALKHGQQAYNSAPDVMHEEIAHSLKYIREQLR